MGKEVGGQELSCVHLTVIGCPQLGKLFGAAGEVL